MDTLKIMKELTQVIGIAGDERRISQLMRTYMEPLCDEIVYDHLGSFFAVKKSKKANAQKVMVCGHMDEVGFMINDITKNGLLKFILIGAIDSQVLLSSRVRVVTQEGKEYVGVIGCSLDDVTTCDVKKMYIDLGATSKNEIEEMGICVGDSAVMDGDFTILNNNRILSKAWDNRFGCVMAIEVLEALKDVELDYDLYIGATVQEEVGMRGATTATGLIQPDMGIVMDCPSANDYKGKDDEIGQLGKGVLIRYYDKGMMPNRALLNYLVKTCQDNQIPHQYFYNMGQTDSAWIHKLFAGCPTLSMCICARGGHTGNSMIDLHDYKSAKKAIINILTSIDHSQIQAFKEENR